jgi:hypothetical protein
MYTVHATKKLLTRVKGPLVTTPEPATTSLGNWYATAMFWRPQVALFVNERTFLPLLIPLAPATTLLNRFPDELSVMLRAVGVSAASIAKERMLMNEGSYAKTANRSVLGVMNRYEFELDFVRERFGGDLLQISLWQADTLVGPLRDYSRTPLEEMLDHIDTGR